MAQITARCVNFFDIYYIFIYIYLIPCVGYTRCPQDLLRKLARVFSHAPPMRTPDNLRSRPMKTPGYPQSKPIKPRQSVTEGGIFSWRENRENRNASRDSGVQLPCVIEPRQNGCRNKRVRARESGALKPTVKWRRSLSVISVPAVIRNEKTI